uniref:Uncharacterized protein n=1 Tax=Monodon monoceros TaxID=40151 RepID=A0A8C6BB40_MONMO
MKAARRGKEFCGGGVRVPAARVVLAIRVARRLLLLRRLRLVPAPRGRAARRRRRRPLPRALPAGAAGPRHREVGDEPRAAGRGRRVVALSALGLAAVVRLLGLALAALGRRRQMGETRDARAGSRVGTEQGEHEAPPGGSVHLGGGGRRQRQGKGTVRPRLLAFYPKRALAHVVSHGRFVVKC